jgi:hypothetical protein
MSVKSIPNPFENPTLQVREVSGQKGVKTRKLLPSHLFRMMKSFASSLQPYYLFSQGEKWRRQQRPANSAAESIKAADLQERGARLIIFSI